MYYFEFYIRSEPGFFRGSDLDPIFSLRPDSDPIFFLNVGFDNPDTVFILIIYEKSEFESLKNRAGIEKLNVIVKWKWVVEEMLIYGYTFYALQGVLFSLELLDCYLSLAMSSGRFCIIQ